MIRILHIANPSLGGEELPRRAANLREAHKRAMSALEGSDPLDTNLLDPTAGLMMRRPPAHRAEEYFALAEEMSSNVEKFALALTGDVASCGEPELNDELRRLIDMAKARDWPVVVAPNPRYSDLLEQLKTVLINRKANVETIRQLDEAIAMNRGKSNGAITSTPIPLESHANGLGCPWSVVLCTDGDELDKGPKNRQYADSAELDPAKP